MKYSNLSLNTSLALILSLSATAALADHKGRQHGGPGGGGGEECITDCEPPLPPPPPPAIDFNWMHSDIWYGTDGDDGAHDLGFTGIGARITVIDDFTSGDLIKGRLTSDDIEDRQHGDWTSLQASLVAPGAAGAADCSAQQPGPCQIDFGSDQAFLPHSSLFDTVNLSYGLHARAAFASAFNTWENLGDPHASVLRAVKHDMAFAAKAAGNDSAAIGDSVQGRVDVLSQQFVRVIEGWDTSFGPTAPVIFVGALDWNPDGTGGAQGTESLASYSNYAGNDLSVQSHFLVVGVEGGRTTTDSLANYGRDCGSVDGTCLYGTSFAAPIVTGYAAIVFDKYQTGTYSPDPSDVAATLLESAHGLNLPGGSNYDRSIYGMGEACLSCALGPEAFIGDSN